MNVADTSVILALCGFSGASIIYLVGLRTGTPQNWRRLATRLANGAFVTATVLLTVTLAFPAATHWRAPTALALACAVAYVSVIAQLGLRLRPIAAFTAPLITLILLSHLFLAPQRLPSVGSSFSGLATAHVITAVLGQTCAILAFAAASLYLLQQKALKRRAISRLLVIFPSLSSLDRLLMFSLWAGSVLFTFSLLTGALFTQSQQTPLGTGLTLKIIWALVVWSWYIIALLVRYGLGRRVRTVAWMSLWGFALLATSYFGMAFFLLPGAA